MTIRIFYYTVVEKNRGDYYFAKNIFMISLVTMLILNELTISYAGQNRLDAEKENNVENGFVLSLDCNPIKRGNYSVVGSNTRISSYR